MGFYNLDQLIALDRLYREESLRRATEQRRLKAAIANPGRRAVLLGRMGGLLVTVGEALQQRAGDEWHRPVSSRRPAQHLK